LARGTIARNETIKGSEIWREDIDYKDGLTNKNERIVELKEVKYPLGGSSEGAIQGDRRSRTHSRKAG
jgi:hypothetical protein